MDARKLVVVMLLALPVSAIGPRSALAQYADPVGESISPQVIDVPFPFQVGAKTLPAGKYDIEQPTREVLIFRSAKGLAFEVPIITRVAKPLSPLVDSKVVFDKFGDSYYISEVWVPGVDGFYVGGTREIHTHRTVKAEKKKVVFVGPCAASLALPPGRPWPSSSSTPLTPRGSGCGCWHAATPPAPFRCA